MSAEENLQRMKTLDDAWNAQNWEVFDPTVGRDAPHKDSEAFFKWIENHLDDNPYRATVWMAGSTARLSDILPAIFFGHGNPVNALLENGREALLSIPTPDHCLPLLSVRVGEAKK